MTVTEISAHIQPNKINSNLNEYLEPTSFAAYLEMRFFIAVKIIMSRGIRQAAKIIV